MTPPTPENSKVKIMFDCQLRSPKYIQTHRNIVSGRSKVPVVAWWGWGQCDNHVKPNTMLRLGSVEKEKYWRTLFTLDRDLQN